MSKYENAYGTDWDSLTEDEAMERAYALGVAASLGEYHREELEEIRAEMDTNYSKSVVDLAFEEGKNEGREIEVSESNSTDVKAKKWQELVEGETVTIDEDDIPTGGRDGLPSAVDRMEALDKPELDSTDAVDLPDFLTKD